MGQDSSASVQPRNFLEFCPALRQCDAGGEHWSAGDDPTHAQSGQAGMKRRPQDLLHRTASCIHHQPCSTCQLAVQRIIRCNMPPERWATAVRWPDDKHVLGPPSPGQLGFVLSAPPTCTFRPTCSLRAKQGSRHSTAGQGPESIEMSPRWASKTAGQQHSLYAR